MSELPTPILFFVAAVMSIIGYNVTFDAIKCYTRRNEKVWLRRILLITAFIPVFSLIFIMFVGICEAVASCFGGTLKDFDKYWGKKQ